MKDKTASNASCLFESISLLCATEIGGLAGNKQADNKAEKTQDGAEDFNNQNLDEAILENGRLVSCVTALSRARQLTV